MIRQFIGGFQRAYTCTCHSVAVSRRSAIKLGASLDHGSSLHTSPTAAALDKDMKGKKTAIRLSQEAKYEQVDDPEMDGQEQEGLTEAGIAIPTLETHKMLVGGVPYSELPVVHIKSSLNNTIMLITDHTGRDSILRNSCGMEGFKHVKKSTNVAAQATGLSLGLKAVKKGLKHVRVTVKGIGAGRLASIKGLQMAGLEVVSITDNTPIPHNGPRPRKVRRI